MALTAGFVVTILVLGVLVHSIVRDLTAAWTGTGLNPFQSVASGGDGNGLPSGDATPSLPLPEVTPVPWNGKTRVTILLLGLDFRDWQNAVGAPRSDTMILLSIEPVTRKVSILSIPRDLWIEIPGFRHNRINTAYSSGEGNRLPGGGPGLAMKAVESLVGVPIQYYAVVDFGTFEGLIDEIGGVDVLVEQRIKISPIGRPSLWLDPKAHHLNGAQTLAYARTRRGAGGDFARARRQQQVALAILDRVVGFDMIGTLVVKAPILLQQLASGVRTNMSLDEMIALAWLGASIDKADIQQEVISPPSMVGFHITDRGAQVLRPVPSEIRKLRDELFVDTSLISQ
ncbi:MAG: LCP family protein [Chloroflexi bacterium]|nr:LCP family protein [Chloroflexota bacterium]